MAGYSEEKGQHAIASVLRYGSGISTLIMALGLAVIILRGPGLSIPSIHRLHLRTVFSNLGRFDPVALIEFGLLLLLLTPILRIVVAAASFALEHDTRYVLISLGVLAVVLLSFAFALAG